MNSALIGYTGFVGSNLDTQHEFTDKYNSKNIKDINGKEYELIVCAAARADKWRINQDPDSDSQDLDSLKRMISQVKAKLFILISTIDVYKVPVNVDENLVLDTNGLHVYGLHRYQLEKFVQKTFDNTLIIRLPGLFGPGLKKNVIFDFLTNNKPFLDQANSDGKFQYYDLRNIWSDIETAVKNKVKLINFATEPITTEEVAKEAFDIRFINHPDGKPAGLYDFKTMHAELYGGSDGYIYDKQTILRLMANFVKEYRDQYA